MKLRSGVEESTGGEASLFKPEVDPLPGFPTGVAGASREDGTAGGSGGRDQVGGGAAKCARPEPGMDLPTLESGAEETGAHAGSRSGQSQGDDGLACAATQSLLRFHSTRPLAESYQGETVTFLLTLGFRDPYMARMYNLLGLMHGVGSKKVAAFRMRPAKAERQPLVKVLEERFPAPVRQR